MRRRLAAALLMLTLTSGFASGGDVITPGRATSPTSSPRWYEQITVSVWSYFRGYFIY